MNSKYDLITADIESYKKVLKDISLTVRDNEIVGIVGESGCGKTTLLKLLLGIIEPTLGEVKFYGQDIKTFKASQIFEFRKSVHMVYQDAGGSLNPLLDVKTILKEPLAIHQIKENHDQLISKMLTNFSLNENCLNKKPSQLSGGEKQRIAIARSLILKPKLLLLDESVSALDNNVQRQILDMLKSYNQETKTSILFISHDLNSIGYLCNRIVVMKNGTIVEDQSKELFFNSPKLEYSNLLINSMM